MHPEDLFGDDPAALRVFAAIDRAALKLEGSTTRTTRSQVAFKRRTNFAAVWSPRRYRSSKAAPLVLSVFLPHRDASARWKEVTKVSERHYTHHLELHGVKDVDTQVRRWLKAAWEAAA